MNGEFNKRIKSFAWRLGNVLLIAGLGFVANNIGDLGLPLWLAGVIGLMTAEVTKWLNK